MDFFLSEIVILPLKHPGINSAVKCSSYENTDKVR